MSEQIDTLGDALPREIERVRELMKDYESIGPTGGWGKLMMSRAIDMAYKAIRESDTVLMLRAYNELKSWKE